jgi:hypothetical protein
MGVTVNRRRDFLVHIAMPSTTIRMQRTHLDIVPRSAKIQLIADTIPNNENKAEDDLGLVGWLWA